MNVVARKALRLQSAGLTYSAIARKLGRTRNGVAGLLYRARTKTEPRPRRLPAVAQVYDYTEKPTVVLPWTIDQFGNLTREIRCE